MDVRVGLWRRLSAEELMLSNCGTGEDSWESPGLQGYQSVKLKGNQPWIFIGRTDAEAETPVLWPPDVKSWPLGKDPDAGKDWRQEEKRVTEDETVGWHHWLNGLEFEQAQGFGDGQGGLVCCSPWGRKELDTTKRLNWTGRKRVSLVSQIVKNLPAMLETGQWKWIQGWLLGVWFV